MAQLTPGIFKAYDIRGVLGITLDESIAHQIGQAFGTVARAKGERVVVVGYDGRLSGLTHCPTLNLSTPNYFKQICHFRYF